MRYGISFGGTFTGMQMDIDRLMRTAVAKDNNLPTLANFNVSQGARQSANEHLVPEQLFNDPNATEKSVEGVSAVKALQIAAQQGQTIYTITKDNYSQVLPKLSLSANVMSDIQNAINAGKQVTVHERNISYKGWNGSGYIILDQTTGTGAYLIDGGANGGVVLPSPSSIFNQDFFFGLANSEISVLLEPNEGTVKWIAFSTVALGVFIAHLNILIDKSKCLFDSQKSALLNGLSSLSLASTIPAPYLNPLLGGMAAYLGTLFVFFEAVHLIQINYATGDC